MRDRLPAGGGAPRALHLRSERGGIALLQSGSDVKTAPTAALDLRVQVVGYGPSASTIGGNRAGWATALAVRRRLAGHGDRPSSEASNPRESAAAG